MAELVRDDFVVLVAIFLAVPAILQPEYTVEVEFGEEIPRPDIWLDSTLEWLVVLAARAWIAALARHDRSRAGDTQ